MAMQSQGSRGLDYKLFKKRLETEKFTKDQLAPLRLRLQLLESFLDTSPKKSSKTAGIWEFEKGTLTIVDLSCPFVDENDACALFNICLSLFLENRNTSSRLVALDEAHKVGNMHLRVNYTRANCTVAFSFYPPNLMKP